MFITGVKTALLEALAAGFGAINSSYYPSDTSVDLTPFSTTIEYPLEEVQWPAIFVQFRPSKSQWTGLNPDVYVTISGAQALTSSREIYFEGTVDLQIMAMHSEERDRLLDSVHNLILMDPPSPASVAFRESISNNDLIAMTFLDSRTISAGDTVSLGTPYSPEELTYEGTIRVQCVGQAYETKFNTIVSGLQSIVVSGFVSINGYVEPQLEFVTHTPRI